MRKLTIDLETHSCVDIKAAGGWRYAADVSTHINTVGYHVTGEPCKVFVNIPHNDKVRSPFEWGLLREEVHAEILSNPIFDEYEITEENIGSRGELESLLEADDTTVYYHNAPFDSNVIFSRLWRTDGWRSKPVVDTMSLARARGLPPRLERVLKALHSPFLKDMEGHSAMHTCASPRAVWKDKPRDKKMWNHGVLPLAKTAAYCLVDVRGQAWLGEHLPPLTAQEQLVWEHLKRRNEQGIRFDVELIDQLLEIAAAQEPVITEEVKRLTNGEISSARKVAELRRFLADEYNVVLPDLRADTIRLAVEDMEKSPEFFQIPIALLRLRQQASLSSVTKIKKIKQMLIGDRVHGLMTYYGAPSTGRITSQGVNTANLPRSGEVEADPFEVVDGIKKGGEDYVRSITDRPFEAIKAAIRPCIIPSEGYEFIGADYSSIEAVLAMWFANEDVYRAMRDNPGLLYLNTASAMYGRPISEKDTAERKRGKIVSLACQYGAGPMGFRTAASNLGWDLGDMTDPQIMPIINSYRRAYPKLTGARGTQYQYQGLWQKLNRAAIAAVQNPGNGRVVNQKITFLYDPKWDSLAMGLPSGRQIHMPFPKLREGKFGKPELTFMASKEGQWKRIKTYGGSLLETACQGLSRDITAAAELRLERNGYRPVVQVYDEIWAEVPKGEGSVEEFEKLLTVDPGWFGDLKVHASGWRLPRMKKM